MTPQEYRNWLDMGILLVAAWAVCFASIINSAWMT